MVRVGHGRYVPFFWWLRTKCVLSRRGYSATAVIARLVRLVARAVDHRFDRDRRRHIRECERRERSLVAQGLRVRR